MMHSDILVLFAGFSGFQPIGIPPEVFCENAAPKNFWKLTGKQLCWIRFLTKLHTEACKFIKMRFQHKSFPVGFVEFLQKTYFSEHLRTAASKTCSSSALMIYIQKQLFADKFQNRFSYKFRTFHRKTPVLESLY